ncbi:uncharacterized protein LOC117134697 [Drosophila busckii]|uniref:uncharacterized protein LOC117134697 n=1 Tax=Drosophila busckii TaxID=30019 RepID=UPI001432A9F7|nr:uncharacterized protein LOC117134697 [Drosophila busckii]
MSTRHSPRRSPRLIEEPQSEATTAASTTTTTTASMAAITATTTAYSGTRSATTVRQRESTPSAKAGVSLETRDKAVKAKGDDTAAQLEYLRQRITMLEEELQAAKTVNVMADTTAPVPGVSETADRPPSCTEATGPRSDGVSGTANVPPFCDIGAHAMENWRAARTKVISREGMPSHSETVHVGPNTHGPMHCYTSSMHTPPYCATNAPATYGTLPRRVGTDDGQPILTPSAALCESTGPYNRFVPRKLPELAATSPSLWPRPARLSSG